MFSFLSQVFTLDPISGFFGQTPIIYFAILLLVIVVIPIIFERLRLPALVGLVCSGVILGSSGLNLFDSRSQIINLLSDIGLAYLMFIAGLEFNFQVLRQQQRRSLVFAGFSFCLPLFLGITTGIFLELDWYSSILIACLGSSYSLLAYPIIHRWGVLNNQSVRMVMGGNVFTDIGTLLIFTVVIASFDIGVFSFAQLINIVVLVVIYFVLVLFGFNWLSKELFQGSGYNEGNKFLSVLICVFLSAVIAQIMGITKIVSFFLVGLAVNQTIDKSSVKEKLVFVGSVLFIPIFFINLGLQLDLSILFNDLKNITLLLLIVAVLMVSKFAVTVLAKLVYHYNWQETLTIFALSIPVLNTTLAVAVGGYHAGLLSVQIFNITIVLSLVMTTIGSWLTSLVAQGAVSPDLAQFEDTSLMPIFKREEASKTKEFRIVVPISNSEHQDYLIELAALLASQLQGKVIPLAIAKTTGKMNTPQLEAACQHSENLLTEATEQSRSFGVKTEPLFRIDDALAAGICRAAREQQANLMIMAWNQHTSWKTRLLGNIIDNVLSSAHCPVAVARLVESPRKIRRILVNIEDLITPTLNPVHFAQSIANANECQITVVNVCKRCTDASKIAARRSLLTQLVSQLNVTNPPDVQIITHDNSTQAILQAARLYDLLILPFHPHRNSLVGTTINDTTNKMLKKLTCSIVIFRDPLPAPKGFW
jgi:Kef-type K+ transport system membrane component KefB